MLVPRPALAALATLLLSACASTHHYQAPQIALPAAFAHAGPATPATAAVAADWWSAYADPDLDRLLRQIGQANPALAQAEARWRQALALVGAARALDQPQLGASAAATRSGAASATGGGTLLATGLDLAWTPDLWGRAARQRQAAEAGAQAQAALRDAARLALELAAAQGYVRLRALDAQLALQGATEAAYVRSLALTRAQYDAGLVARADVIQAETQLQSLRTQVFTIGRQRALQANALALLAGSTPAELPIAARAPGMVALPGMPPVPAALPAELLRRRPDLAAAERQLAAAHAQWGVAQTAWLPDLTLSASGGLQAGSLARLLDAPARVWSLGPALAATLFDGGTRRAAEAQALAAYDEQAAAWRAGVLAAVRETEDALAQLATLSDQEREQQRLVALAAENERVVGYRYEAGEISFLEVATAQNLALAARRALVDVQAERLVASMGLVGALGGGWEGRL
ncbi:efflux transporter outer membrane subunit [Pseudorhodoferax sp.]|uniref:efflux transporter outer membrane subunit n=1 Tax=Pseudorhodoferax sp. TaxID=1993553 RepID=UPI002DD6380E|nr:efflux transporter outer membrane subunit [Pseudorhodoferax sp.]